MINSLEDRLCLSRDPYGKTSARLVRENEPDLVFPFELAEGLRGNGPVRFIETEPKGYLRVNVGQVGLRPEFAGFVRSVELEELRETTKG